MSRKWSTSTQQLVWSIWLKRIIGNEKKGFANASDYLETWDDSDIITNVNAQNFRDILQNGAITTQHHNDKVLRPAMHIRK